jgi:DNA repair protein RecN (Recombination protein N)
MLRWIRIEGLAVVASLELEFSDGLNVLTGETGAGKSLILSALGLLGGGRPPKDVVREDVDRAVVEASFDTRGLPELEAELAERGLEGEAHELIVRREVPHQGRGRCRVSGVTVPVGILRELFAGQLEISSQHDSQALLRSEEHGALLDRFGKLDAERAALRRTFEALRALREEYDELGSASAERARRADFLRFQIAEIEAAELEPGEFARVRAERERLRHAEQIQAVLVSGSALLEGDPGTQNESGAGDAVGRAEQLLRGVVAFDAELEPLVARLEAARVELHDLAATLRDRGEGRGADAGALAALEERFRTLEDLRRKYGDAEEDVLAQRAALAEELAQLDHSDDRREALEVEIGSVHSELERRAGKLTRGRSRAAKELAQRVSASLEALALPGAVFQVALEPMRAPEGMPCASAGGEHAVFRFAANGESEPRPLQRVASGGELSRLQLAIKGATRGAGSGMSIVFDEVDAGVGGRAADRVGDALAELAQSHQVLCITHLPQIAARGDRHLRIEKRRVRGKQQTVAVALSGRERVEEIARMAGGEGVTATTRRHARELLARPPSVGPKAPPA